MLQDDEDNMNDIELVTPNNNIRTRKSKRDFSDFDDDLKTRKAKEDFEDESLLVAVAGGRPPTRPPNDQCVEAEIQPDDTLASISLKVCFVLHVRTLLF